MSPLPSMRRLALSTESFILLPARASMFIHRERWFAWRDVNCCCIRAQSLTLFTFTLDTSAEAQYYSMTTDRKLHEEEDPE